MLRDIVARNRAGAAVAVPSVCSAQPDVLRASMLRAEALERPLVIEATSNQVNQDGGYTGMTPSDFAGFVRSMADDLGVDRARLVLGGDHLGPQAWRKLPADAAMDKARTLVADYVRAGFAKIHLDCSEGCAGEAAQLADAVTAERSADLAQVCEGAAPDAGLLYVIGTEVPPPGGARMDEAGDIPATSPDAATATLAAHEAAFARAGLAEIMPRVAGLVVQPGVEFSPMQVHHLPMNRDPALREVALSWPGLCLEAHSTDYQAPAAYPRLAALGFAFQKVGPALTFAYREALYALDAALAIAGRAVGLIDVMEEVMQADPGYWQGHYAAGDRIARHAGLADRIRYYWPAPKAQAAVAELRARVSEAAMPDPLLWQVFAPAVLDRAEALCGPQAQRLIDAQIQFALDPYFFDDQGGGDD